jgi:hypothetical protein
VLPLLLDEVLLLLDEVLLLLDALLPLVEVEDDAVDDDAPADALEEAPPTASPPVDDEVAATRPPEHAATVREQRRRKQRRRPMRARIHGTARHGDERATILPRSTAVPPHPQAPPVTPALVVPCRWSTIRSSGVGRIFSRLAVIALVAPVALGGVVSQALELIGHPAARAVDDLVPVSMAAAVGAWIWLTVLSAIANAESVGATGGHLRVDAGGVTVLGGSVAFPHDRIVGGLVVHTVLGPAVELHLRRGRVFRAELYAEREAHAVLEALGLGPDRRRVVAPLGRPNAPTAVGCFTLLVAMACWAIVIFAVGEHWWGHGHGALAILAWGLLVVGTTLLAARASEPVEVSIGAEGVRVRGPFRARFVRFEQIEGVSGEHGRLVLQLRGRRPTRITVASPDAGLAVGLADRIRDAMALARHGASPTVANLLDPGDLPFAAWRSQIARLLRGTSHYRRAGLSDDEVLGVLEDPGAPPVRRIGAALALRESRDPEARRRVRISADACADDETRAALEAAAAEALDEGAIRRAVEKLGSGSTR